MTTPVAHAPIPSVAGVTVSPERERLWSAPLPLWAPRTLVVAGGAALTVGRAHTAYRKIIDVLAADTAGFRDAVMAAVADRGFVDELHPGPVVIRFEEHPHLAPLTHEHEAVLRELGFTRDPDPLISVPSTRPHDTAHTRGWSLWLAAAPQRTVPYYGQTTDVTCGAVTALMMLEADGAARFGNDGDTNQEIEIDYWRRATNLPACDPISLAVTTAQELAVAARKPEVVLSAHEAVLLEDFAGQPYEIRLREQLQHDALRRAQALDLTIDYRWIEVTEIRDLVAAGHDVFLLIALEPLIGDPAPHWVLAHDVVSSDSVGDCLVVSDPWIDQLHGESWVDTSSLPIPLPGIDLIMRWGDPAYRGAIVVPARAQ